ncbi:MAG TPA: hypothetical protein VJT31_11270, partial [Rugosimonospora sp.]|nr:hypothetical protein [Rugosimonospora sp.]
GLSLLAGSADAVRRVPVESAGDTGVYQAIDALRGAGLTRVYSDYRTCGMVNFLTREQVHCAVLDDSLHRGMDRYPPERLAVSSAARPAYLLRTGSPAQVALDAWLRRNRVAAPVTVVGGYTLYHPTARLPVPLV